MSTTFSTTVRPHDLTTLVDVFVPAVGGYAADQTVTRRRRAPKSEGTCATTDPRFNTLDATGLNIVSSVFGGMTNDVQVLGSAPPRGRYR